MASGASVSIDIQPWGMNVFALAPSEDINNTRGLCGTFDGNPGNDYLPRGLSRAGAVDTFVRSWRYASNYVITWRHQ